MSELNNIEKLAKSICAHFQFNDETTQACIKSAGECADYLQEHASSEAKMVSQLVAESARHSLLSSMLSYSRLLILGTSIPRPSPHKENYYEFVVTQLIFTAGVFYKQGYDDAKSIKMPESFEDFISGLDFNASDTPS